MRNVRTSFVRLVLISHIKNARIHAPEALCIAYACPGEIIAGAHKTTFTLARVYD